MSSSISAIPEPSDDLTITDLKQDKTSKSGKISFTGIVTTKEGKHFRVTVSLPGETAAKNTEGKVRDLIKAVGSDLITALGETQSKLITMGSESKIIRNKNVNGECYDKHCDRPARLAVVRENLPAA